MSTNCLKCMLGTADGLDHLCSDCRSGYGCTCSNCGRIYKMDLLVPDDIWKKISPKKSTAGLLCPACIVVAVEKLKGFSAFEMVKTSSSLAQMKKEG